MAAELLTSRALIHVVGWMVGCLVGQSSVSQLFGYLVIHFHIPSFCCTANARGSSRYGVFTSRNKFAHTHARMQNEIKTVKSICNCTVARY